MHISNCLIKNLINISFVNTTGSIKGTVYYKLVISKSKVYVPLTLTIRDDLTWSVCVNEDIEIC